MCGLFHMQTVRLLLEYNSNPYQENDQGLSPIDVCKNPEILCLLREERAPREDAREESEEEDVFVPKEKKLRLRDSHLKSGSKGSSRSSVDSFYEEDGGKNVGSSHNVKGINTTPDGSGRMDRKMDHTPKSRPRNVLYSDLSSSESEEEHSYPPGGKSGVHKVRYHLAKMGEAKQKLLGKLEESRELESGRVKGGEVIDGRGKEGDSEAMDDDPTGVCVCMYVGGCYRERQYRQYSAGGVLFRGISLFSVVLPFFIHRFNWCFSYACN